MTDSVIRRSAKLFFQVKVKLTRKNLRVTKNMKKWSCLYLETLFCDLYKLVFNGNSKRWEFLSDYTNLGRGSSRSPKLLEKSKIVIWNAQRVPQYNGAQYPSTKRN